MIATDESELEADYAEVSRSPSQVLVADNLRKSYGPRQALRGLTFSLNAGRVLGFLGPNGAGKTTAIRILTTILEPDSGHFMVDGITSDHPDMIRQKIGVLPESMGFPKHSTGVEFLTFFGQLYGRPAKEARAYANTLLEEVGLQQRARSLIGSYSRGMRQRLGIARALVNNPVVLFLDEPTLGLDPRGQQELLALIQGITSGRNVGVILCSHVLSEVEVVCDDVVILHEGQSVATGPVAEVIERARQNDIHANVFRVQVPPRWLDQAQQQLDAAAEVRTVTPMGHAAGWLRVELSDLAYETATDDNRPNPILETLTRGGIPVLNFQAEGGRLQDVFLHLTEDSN